MKRSVGSRPAINSKLALSRTDHRPWPRPREPWLMAQTWHDLLFAHWPLPPKRLRPLVPSSLSLDTYDGQAWIGVVPFWMGGVRPRAVPDLPWISTFPELNVRTYVTLDDKPGVFFFSLDAARWLAVMGARYLFRLPYFHARMRVRLRGELVRYASDRIHRGAPPASLRMSYRPIGGTYEPARGTLEHFLTERYCLYTCAPDGQALICEIQHPPWPLQPAEAEIAMNTMASAAGVELPDTAPLLHFSKRQDMIGWPLRRANG